MTEREYIQAIRDAAARYVEVIREPTAHEEDGAARIRRREAIKEKLGAFTAIELCDAWLRSSGA
jgi:hypothetical protein